MLRMITKNLSCATFHRCSSKSNSLIQLLKCLQQNACQIIERESHSDDCLRTVEKKQALIESPNKPFYIRHNKRGNFHNYLILGRNMASSSSSSNSQHNDQNATPNSNSKTKFAATKEDLKARLSPIQYQVTQLKATERPGSGQYNKFNKKGIYHCIVCNEELFKSDTKFESGCGWPAFFDTIDQKKLKFVQDYELVGSTNLLLLAKRADLIRTEVLCNNCNAHLGHRFDDGPISKGGKRYCINSASLRFTPNIEDK